MNFLFVFLLLFTIFIEKSHPEETYECNIGYCKAVVDNGECPTLEKTDDDHKLPILPPTKCNCCEYYLIKLDKGQPCLKGSPSSPLPFSVCGDGLYCKTSDNSESGICDTMETQCTKEQAEYDKKLNDGTLGSMEVRPECDRNGDYSALWCIPGQICYCRNKEGERIFGTVPYSSLVKNDVTCDCARKVDIAQKLLNEFDISMNLMRCLPNGNYDPLQCLNNETCLCTEEKTGNPSDYDWSRKPVKIPDISNDTLSCFNPKIHSKGQFLKPCQKEYEKVKSERLKMKEQGVIYLGNKLPRCQPDGLYDKIQENDTSKFCASPTDGKPLENFVVSKSSPLANSMSCNCARARLILQEQEHTDLPECCENGNYVPIQCRLDECYCVDDNGNQIVKEVHKDNIKDLKCTDLCTEPSK